MQPYLTGTITAEDDSRQVVGNGTLWTNTVHEGDLLVVNNKIYPISEVVDETHITLYTNTTEAFSNSAYFIARTASNWGSNADVAAKVTETMDLYKNKLKGNYINFALDDDIWSEHYDSELDTNYINNYAIASSTEGSHIEVYMPKSCCLEAAACNLIIEASDGYVKFYARKKPTVPISGQLRIY